MINQSLSTRLTPFNAPHVACQPRARFARPACVKIVALGSVNDPEKTAKNKEKKAKDSEWAEPHNKNPLEKKTIARGDPGKESEGGGNNPLKGVGDAISGAVDEVTKPKKEK